MRDTARTDGDDAVSRPDARRIGRAADDDVRDDGRVQSVSTLGLRGFDGHSGLRRSRIGIEPGFDEYREVFDVTIEFVETFHDDRARLGYRPGVGCGRRLEQCQQYEGVHGDLLKRAVRATVRAVLLSRKGSATVALFFGGVMSKKKRKRDADLVVRWKGKVSRIIGQGSDGEVNELVRLIMHKRLSNDQKYLVLEGAIFEVWGQRLADREEERRTRRQKARQERRERDTRRDWEGMDDSIARADQAAADTGALPQVPIPDTAKPEH